MRIVVVNPNTTTAMTDAVVASARAVVDDRTEIVGLTPSFGADGIDCVAHSLLSAVAVMDVVSHYDQPFDALVLAGFGEHGREGLQELLEVPVVDMADAAAHVAMMLGRTFSVVTTLQRSVAAVEDRLRLSGLLGRCASIRATGMTTLETDADPQGAVAAIVEQARQAVRDDHAEVLVLGCGGMAGLEEAVTAATGTPVVEGVAAAVVLAQALVRLGLRTSKVGTYAAVPPARVTPFR